MSRFIQIHLLTAYPPANLNRDDQGSPKTAKMGGYDRLRVSSQCLKRTWRTSKIFEDAIAKGVRTKMIGVDAYNKLSQFSKLSPSDSKEIAKNIASVFGALKTNSLELETLVFISDQEQQNVDNVIEGFKNGIGEATEESNSLGLELYQILVSDIIAPIKELIEVMKTETGGLLLTKDWSKPKGIKEIIKNSKKADDKSPYDYISRMIENSSEWIENIKGDELVREDQLELFFAVDELKLTKEILKKLSLGSLLPSAKTKEVEYGEIKHKDHIKLCKGSQEQLRQWVTDVKKTEDVDFLSEENIEKLKLAISPVAITKSSILTNENPNADIALFGRMLASSVGNNIEAACQVAHAISVHPIVIEDDYFTAVEELNEYRDDAGAAHIGETRFAAGLFYSYVCINRELLIDNLGGDEADEALANRAIRALTEAAVKVAPEGKQNSFASRAYASFVLAEKGDQQPRSLSIAYLKPIMDRESQDFAADAITALTRQKANFDKVYGACSDATYELNVPEVKGSLSELLDFVSQ